MTGAHALASKVAAGQFGPTVHAWLQKGFSAHAAACGDVPLERCLRLGTQKKRARVARDAWLLKAWHLLTEVPAGRGRSNALAQQLRHFEATFWTSKQAGRDLQAPPAGTSELRVSLFHAAKTGARLPTTGKMIHIICCERYGKFLTDDISTHSADNELINHERKK